MNLLYKVQKWIRNEMFWTRRRNGDEKLRTRFPGRQAKKTRRKFRDRNR